MTADEQLLVCRGGWTRLSVCQKDTDRCTSRVVQCRYIYIKNIYIYMV